MNEETYYERMENSSKDKMSALKYFNPGDSILDFGAGKLKNGNATPYFPNKMLMVI